MDGLMGGLAEEVERLRAEKEELAKRHKRLTREVRVVAADLLEIAEMAMPSSYFQTDSRVQRARDVLGKTEEP